MNEVIASTIIASLDVIALILAYLLGVFTAKATDSTETHRAYLKGYKKGLEKGRKENGDNNNL